jgi:hypothetical protein
MNHYALWSEGLRPSTTNDGKRFKLYAVWHHCHLLGTRGACAISENPETLMPLHLEKTENPQSLWHNYKHRVSEVKVEPIECYTYNVETKSIEPYNDSQNAEDHAFYAFNTTCNDNIGISFYDDIVLKVADSDGNILDNDDFDDFDKGEVLIYLSKSCHSLWRECSIKYRESCCDDKDDFIMDPDLPIFFYLDWTSDLPVEPNVYYEEGIMNA